MSYLSMPLEAYTETITVYNYGEVVNMVSKTTTDSGSLDDDNDGLSNAEELTSRNSLGQNLFAKPGP